ncbi:MAG: hypothetical protein JWN44_6496 [Myxococcales bacterium]|nr:hypothetical protein [Myxococcales bacterium]
MNVKGTVLKARLRYVEERGGGTAGLAFREALSAHTRQLIDERIRPNSWYPFGAFVEMCEVIDRQLGKGDLELCHELGRHACDANLPTLYKIFFRMADVMYVIRRAAAAWRVSYDEGSMTVLGEGDHLVTMRMEVPTPHRAHCLSVRGWIVRAGELSGAKGVEIEERCRLRGDPHCEFTLRWRDK